MERITFPAANGLFGLTTVVSTVLGMGNHLSDISGEFGRENPVPAGAMVLFAFLRGFRWWWLALAAHTTVDFVAVAALHLATKAWDGTTALLATEGLVTLMGAAAIWFIVLTRCWTQAVEAHPSAETHQTGI